MQDKNSENIKKNSKTNNILQEFKTIKKDILLEPDLVINKLPKIIVEFISYIENNYNNLNDKKKQNSKNKDSFNLLNMLNLILDCKNILYSIFDYFLLKNKNSVKLKVKEFILCKITTLNSFYLDVLSLDNDYLQDWNAIILEFIRANIEYFVKYKENNLVIYNKVKHTLKEIINNGIVFNNKYILSQEMLNLIINNFIVYEEFSTLLSEYSLLINNNRNELDHSNKNNYKNNNINNSTISSNNQKIINNQINFLFSFPSVKSILKDNKDKENINELLESIKESYQLFLISFLDNNYISIKDSDIIDVIMKKLVSHMFGLCKNPLILSEFILKIYKREQCNSDNKILSINCLFVLITKYNYIFENYYEALYECLFMKNVSYSEYFNKLLKIIYFSISPSGVSKAIVCAFIKKLARLSLLSKTESCLKMLSLIEFLFHSHHKCLTMLYRKRHYQLIKSNKNNVKDVLQCTITTITDNKNIINIKNNSYPIVNEINIIDKSKLPKKNVESESQNNINDNYEDNNKTTFYEKENKHFNDKLECIIAEEEDKHFNDYSLINNEFNNNIMHMSIYDRYVESEKNPVLSGANKSCLWELYTLQKHYNFKIKEKVKRLSKKFIKKDLDIETIMNIDKEESLFNLSDKSYFYIDYETLDDISIDNKHSAIIK